ncbi:MAG TPA: MBL fold metallo-hydrolase [Xanthobacteraceae bacterium]|nr:MBL fold metallo-hydrolase [Xanthobacteraceae bacterium]
MPDPHDGAARTGASAHSRQSATRTVGDVTVTAVSDGVLNSGHDVILGIDKAESERLTGVPYGQTLPLDVNCFLIRHDGRLILSDVGAGHAMGPTLGKLPQSLREIGVEPGAIDTILLTHLHSDHSLGLVDAAGKAVFPTAELVVHEVEAAFWLDRAPQDSDSARVARNTKAQRAAVAPYRDRIRRIGDGAVLPSISAILQSGHTPGHTNWLIQSKGERLLLWGDIVHLATVQMPRPDAGLVFDVDPQMARQTREHVFDWTARERLCVAGAHLGYPGFGYVDRAGRGFAFAPA